MESIKPIYNEPHSGNILISEPFLNDFYFKRAVVLLAEYTKEGSFGLIVNKPVNLKLKKVVKECTDFNAKIFIGGPVRTDSLFVLHTLGDKIPESSKIIEGIYWGGDMEVIRDMIINRAISPDDIRFYIGYAGWNSLQLENELKEKSWVISNTAKEEILNEHPETLWNTIVKNLGKDYSLWSNFPFDPILN